MTKEMEETFQQFWQRDYGADVRLLNRSVGRRNQPAGFEEVPPSVLTGDPFVLQPGRCLAVFGLNPKWQAGGWVAPRAKYDVIPAREEHEKGDWRRYKERRARYFLERDPQYYGRYFTKLANRLGEAFSASGRSREFFRTSAIKLDLLPWFSSDLSGVDAANLHAALPPVAAWKNVIQAALSTLRPRAIVVNGSGYPALVSSLLGTELRRFEVRVGNCTGRAYAGAIGPSRTPLLVHAQLNAIGAPSSGERYSAMVQQWKREFCPTLQLHL